MEKNYNHHSAEPQTYAAWQQANAFAARINPNKIPFSIVMPPPNVTGQLHIGHAYDNSLQDILIRAKRLQGFEACWVPGVDHAGIATQARVEKALREEGISRHDLGRDAFLERVWAWKNKYGDRITEQLKLLGVSCDWSRQRFTMDEGCSEAVLEAFVRLYEKGLIYKGLRIINWCPECVTALSNDEVEHTEKEGNLWHIRYAVKNSDEFLTVATTRPETMLGDAAVAVHPNDERYAHLIGKTVILPLLEREIPVIADEYVDREFGTGVVKITPSHDPNDFEVASRHALPQVIIFDGKATINENGGQYHGLERFAARKKILADLNEQGLLAATEKRTHAVGTCYRCNSVIEPLASKQWFVKMEPLAKRALEVVENEQMVFEPERFTKIYTHWMTNIRDWCISRQLWWGHRIPAYTCEQCEKLEVARDVPGVCICGASAWTQETDVLDTWFSAGLFPLAVFGWPNKTPDLEYFYPTNVVVPGYEIIFFWVARMIMFGLEFNDDVPFRTAFIHGIVRADDGRKISKSLDNGVDVEEVLKQYGADSVRLALTVGVGNGSDLRFSDERCEYMRNFGNKLWNAARFVHSNLTISEWTLPTDLKQEDKWILNRLHTTIDSVTAAIDRYDLGMAGQEMIDFVWNDFCDWYIELSKPRVFDKEESVQRVLIYVLSQILVLLHPFMPFITEEIWQQLPYPGRGSELLISAQWPKTYNNAELGEATAAMERVMDAIRAIRASRAELNVPPSKKTAITIITAFPAAYQNGEAFILRLASGETLHVTHSKPDDLSGYIQAATAEALILLPLDQLVDKTAERERLKRELAKIDKELAPLIARLANDGFLAKAPANVVTDLRENVAALEAKSVKLREGLAALEANG